MANEFPGKNRIHFDAGFINRVIRGEVDAMLKKMSGGAPVRITDFEFDSIYTYREAPKLKVEFTTDPEYVEAGSTEKASLRGITDMSI